MLLVFFVLYPVMSYLYNSKEILSSIHIVPCWGGTHNSLDLKKPP